MFTSLDQLRRMPSSTAAQVDDWKWCWVCFCMRPVLEWWTTTTLSASTVAAIPEARALEAMEFTDGDGGPFSFQR